MKFKKREWDDYIFNTFSENMEVRMTQQPRHSYARPREDHYINEPSAFYVNDTLFLNAQLIIDGSGDACGVYSMTVT